MAIAGRLTPVAFGVIFALSGAIGPIIGQNFGAGRMDRVRRAFLDGLIFTGAGDRAGLGAAVRPARADRRCCSTATGVTRDLVYLFCGPLALLFFFNGVIFVSQRGLQQPGPAVLVHAGELGAPYAGHDPLRAGVRRALGRAGRAGGAGGGRGDLRRAGLVAGAAGDRKSRTPARCRPAPSRAPQASGPDRLTCPGGPRAEPSPSARTVSPLPAPIPAG